MNGKSILITGGTGAFGSAFARRLLLATKEKERIVMFSRGEHRQSFMAEELRPLDPFGRLRWFIGDVRDRERLRRAMHGIEVVIHAAALKRIEVGHYNPIEMVKTNIVGSINVIEAACDANVRKVIFLSSDKAFQPVSPYGASKALAESIFISANSTTGWDGPKFSVCRYGNVWKSTGSVVPTWKQLIANGAKSVPVTDPDCTRFFMRMEEAIDLVISAEDKSMDGQIIIPKLPAYRIGDLAEAMGAGIEITGLPTWEKKHESMAEGNSSDKARRMTIQEINMALSND